MELRLDRTDVRLIGVTIVTIALLLSLFFRYGYVRDSRLMEVDEQCWTNIYCRFFTTGEEEWYEAILYLEVGPSHVFAVNDTEWQKLRRGEEFTPVVDWEEFVHWEKFRKPAGERWHFIIYIESGHDEKGPLYGGFVVVDFQSVALYWIAVVSWVLFTAGGIWLVVLGGWRIRRKGEAFRSQFKPRGKRPSEEE